jgi:hypothetical protein
VLANEILTSKEELYTTRTSHQKFLSLLPSSDVHPDVADTYMEIISDYRWKECCKVPGQDRTVVFSHSFMHLLQSQDQATAVKSIRNPVDIFFGTKRALFPGRIGGNESFFIEVDFLKKEISYYDSVNLNTVEEEKAHKKSALIEMKRVKTFLMKYARLWGRYDDFFDNVNVKSWKSIVANSPTYGLVPEDSSVLQLIGMEFRFHDLPWDGAQLRDGEILNYRNRVAAVVRGGSCSYPPVMTHFKGIQLAAQLRSSHEGSGAIDLSKSTALDMVWYFLRMILVYGIYIFYWCGCGGACETLNVIGWLYVLLPPEEFAKLRFIALELIADSTSMNNCIKMLTKIPGISLSKVLRLFVGADFLDMFLSTGLNAAFYSCSTVYERFYLRVMIKLVKQGEVKTIIIAQR